MITALVCLSVGFTFGYILRGLLALGDVRELERLETDRILEDACRRIAQRHQEPDR